MDRPVTSAASQSIFAITALLCRTSDRTEGASKGAKALARLLATQAATEARMVGSFGEAAARDWSEDLRDSRGCILEAGGQVEDALVARRLPLLFASDCSICLTTLQAAIREDPETMILWFDAHGDFNSPDTTPSGFLGGMCLAGACGVWDAGIGPTIDPARVVICGVRDIDPGEQRLLEEAGVTLVPPNEEALGKLRYVLEAGPIYVHLDMDVLDPDEMPVQFPVPGGFSIEELQYLINDILDECELVGMEVTGLEEPDFAPAALEVIRPLLRFTAGGAADQEDAGQDAPWR